MPKSNRDPIFVAIERYVVAETKCNKIDDMLETRPGGNRRLYRAAHAVRSARLSLAQTAPTTLAGLAAYARFLNHQSSVVFRDQFFDKDGGPEYIAFHASLERSIAAIAGGTAST